MSRVAELAARLAEHKAELARKYAARHWIPHPLHPKQREFLALRQREALFGGAAGGGKTDALLAGGLEYVNRRQFSALILRRTYPALKLRGSIMARAKEWLGSTDAEWHEQDKVWRFPSGATLQFGYCNDENDLDRYKSAEFHYIAIDELTEWPELWYGFLFSRVRRLAGDTIPLKMRAGTNPDGLGAEWVRRRFGIPESEIVGAPIVGPDRVFMPARAEDNPSLDLLEYEKSLEAMTGSRTSARFQQLRWGRWIRSGEGLVYGSYSPSRNIIEHAPRRPDGTSALTNHVLAMDYGYSNATSFNVLGWREHDPVVYVLKSYKKTNLTPSDAALEAQTLEKAYAFDKIVGDVGGLGKGYAEEARKRFSIPVEPADKNNKRGYIDLFNGDLARARVLLVESETKDLQAEMAELPWDVDRKAEAKGFANHCTDGTLYGWRACSAYHEAPVEERPKPGTAEALAIEEERILEERIAEVEKGRGREWWEG